MWGNCDSVTKLAQQNWRSLPAVDYATSEFQIGSDLHGGTAITYG
jgi:hypothetical protein